MELTLERIEQKMGAQTHLYPLELTLESGRSTTSAAARYAFGHASSDPDACARAL